MMSLKRIWKRYLNLNKNKLVILTLFILFLIILFLRDKKRDADDSRGNLLLCRTQNKSVVPNLPIIYVITPTYARPVQKAELTRLCHTFLLVTNLHWILIEDAEDKTNLVYNFLSACGVSYTHLNIQTPPDMKLAIGEKTWRKPRGVWQRNKGIDWVRANAQENGVLYFADDDNTYSLDLFQEIRTVKGVGVWPVGLVGGLMVEKPKVDVSGHVVGWDVGWDVKRPFATDMAGFAVNLKLFLSKPDTKFSHQNKIGSMESEFLKNLVKIEDLEVKADSGSKVLVWHTRSQNVKLDMELKRKDAGLPPSNQGIEV